MPLQFYSLTKKKKLFPLIPVPSLREQLLSDRPLFSWHVQTCRRNKSNNKTTIESQLFFFEQQNIYFHMKNGTKIIL